MAEKIKEIRSRIAQKHDIEVNWIKAGVAEHPFVPLQGEFIVYDIETEEDELPTGRIERYTYERIKLGDGVTAINELPFITEHVTLLSSQIIHGDYLLSNLINDYLLNVDYNLLAFDTSEIVINNTTNNTSILGQAILGQMILD